MLYVVDGYNVYYTGIAEPTPGIDTEKVRDEVIARLRRFCLAKKVKSIVFFDGGPQAAHLPRTALRESVEIRFSPPRSDADTEIKDFLARYPNPRELRLITSDRAIQRVAEKLRVRWTGSRDFLREIAAALASEEDAVPNDEPLEKYEGTTDDELAYWMRVFGQPNKQG